jgi:transcriptional regulator with XRE-family HTH domain
MFTGRQLREYRHRRHLSQRALGKAVCMSRDAIAKIELYNRAISDIQTLKALQRALNIPYEVIGFIPIEALDEDSQP